MPASTLASLSAQKDAAAKNAPQLRSKLLAWYDANRRDLPWRHTQDPYAIWVSEIMLQQTRVAAVIERYTAFMERFPTVKALAAAPEHDVLALWSGLGYYRRARMLHKAAQQLAENYAGKLPETAEALRKLPGIGAYTAAAIASIAYGERAAVVDGNVERVICRLSGWEADGRAGATALRRRIDEQAAQLLDPARPGDFNQSMMELGATVCTPRSPQCGACPLVEFCITRGEHKTTPRPKMQSRAIAYVLVLRKERRTQVPHEVLLEQRSSSQSVMPGLWELPLLASADVPDESMSLAVRHAIMQVNYDVRVREVGAKHVRALTVEGGERRWVPLEEAAQMPLTGLARKILTRLHLLPHRQRSKALSLAGAQTTRSSRRKENG
jgi:A/G-specific adenine glycosylase